MTHSLFGPSSLRRRCLCPGSYRLEKDCPDTDSTDARRGTNLHAIVSHAIVDKMPLPDLPQADEDAVRFCLEAVNGVLATWKFKHDYTLHSELEINYASYLPDVKCGTADLVVLFKDKAEILEFKFGFIQEPVARDNIQLAAYALGVARKFKLKCVDVWLIQPALHHSSHHSFANADFGAIEYMLMDICERAKKIDAPISPGEDQCRYCKGAAVCPALRQTLEELPVKAEPASLTPIQISGLLDQIPMAERFIEQLRKLALEQAQTGVIIPGYAIGEGRKTREWSIEASQGLPALAEQFGKPVSSLQVVTMATPAQLEASWGKSKAVREALDSLIITLPGRPCLRKVATK